MDDHRLHPLPGRWLRWKMFCRTTFTIIMLTGTTKDGRAEPVNVYLHLSPGSFILGRPSSRRSSTTSPQTAGTTESTATAASCLPTVSTPWK
ncbi:hypothetical protein [Streptomyces sp. NBC_01334]|uniref:hypothetical protein n=1 Tax=Streptomyces sp. NBC_01334 TaxID=2903827 RepID=UPI002E1365E9|nr:hypothetical protein OG736_45090 [Streptomyces sp. NBC_01334]